MTRWIIIIALLLASAISMIIANRFVKYRSKAGIFYWIGMAGMTLTIISGFIVSDFAKGFDQDDIVSRSLLGAIPALLIIITCSAIWITAQRDLDEMTEMLRNRGLTIGLFIALMFFYCYGAFQLAGVPLPDFSGFGVGWVLFPCMLVPQLFLNWKYR